MFTGLTNALKGLSGEYELTRVAGFAGTATYIIGANAFQIWNMAKGNAFDVTAYCLAFPGGLAALGLGTGGAVAIKDRSVATAKVIANTGTVPGKAEGAT